ELVEQVAGVVEGALGGQGHLVAGAAGVGEALPGEAVERLVDGLGLGEAGRGVVEVNHRVLTGARIAGGALGREPRRPGSLRSLAARPLPARNRGAHGTWGTCRPSAGCTLRPGR